ncbi:MAG TPA: hypothetical protein VEF34_13420 [Syntrophobacteraceae bacterium]|nr:hypothetical protein [Syntrophobacteraceae bacterium]
MSRKGVIVVHILLTIATLAALWQLNDCKFIDYDDGTYITGNSHIRHGLTTDGVRWAFSAACAANWHPLTWISHMTDVQLFGLNRRMHHLINLLFHIANTLMLFFVFHRMTKALWQSAFIAALFALHPLHVESVAWAAERKDVLSSFFWMLTMIAYAHYAQNPGLRRYLPVLLFFILGLMAKPMLVTLPFALLLLDYWPLRRILRVGPSYAPHISDDDRRESKFDVTDPMPPIDKRSDPHIHARVPLPEKKKKKLNNRNAVQGVAQASVPGPIQQNG